MEPEADRRRRELRSDLIVARGEGDRSGEARAWEALAQDYQAQKHWQASLHAYQQALKSYRACGDWVRGAWVLCPLATLLQRFGQPQEAQGLLREATHLLHSLPTLTQQAAFGTTITTTALTLAQPTEAISAGCWVLPLFQMCGDQAGELRILQHLGSAYRATRQWGAATQCFIQSVILAEALAAPRVAARHLCDLGDLAVAQRQPDAACSYFHAACRVFQALADPLNEGRALTALGQGWLQWGDFVQAVACWRRAQNCLALGAPREGQRLANYLATLRHHLGAEGFEEVWQASQTRDALSWNTPHL